MSRRFTIEPSARQPAVGNEEDLSGQFGVAVSRRFAEMGPAGRRGTPETVAFGLLAASLRAAQGLDRVELSTRARLNPVYLTMLEMGLLGPDEIPPVVAAKLAVAAGRRISELPVLPYPAGQEPADLIEVDEQGVRIFLGLRQLAPWVEAMLQRAEGGHRPVRVDLPELVLAADDAGVAVRDAHLSNSPLPGPASDEYSFQVVRGHAQGTAPTWWAHASAPPGTGLELQVGSRRLHAVGDRTGRLRFEGVEPADIEPLRFTLVQRP